jgi:hypothetical protein
MTLPARNPATNPTTIQASIPPGCNDAAKTSASVISFISLFTFTFILH